MTVSELKELLDQMDPDMEVMTSYPSGNYWNQEYASHINSVYCGAITDNNEGGYKLVNDDYIDDTEEINYDTVIISWV